MGDFSFKCKKSGLPVASGDGVRMFLLKGGEPIEEMAGRNSNYGNVLNEKGEELKWKMDWSDVCDLIFTGGKKNGIAVVLECYYEEGYVPTTQSEDDPDQGWGRKNGKGKVVKQPYHKIY